MPLIFHLFLILLLFGISPLSANEQTSEPAPKQLKVQWKQMAVGNDTEATGKASLGGQAQKVDRYAPLVGELDKDGRLTFTHGKTETISSQRAEEVSQEKEPK